MIDRCLRIIVVFLVVTVVLGSTTAAFAQGESTEPYSRLDSRPYDPAVDPDIDLFMNNRAESVPGITHGAIVEREILTPCSGDPLRPERKGAVLEYLSGVSYGALYGGAETQPEALDGEQEILYITSGLGYITAGDTRIELKKGVFVLIPAALTFTIVNNSEEPLAMYIIREPAPDGFRPNESLVVVNEDSLKMGPPSHWSHLAKGIFRTGDGLGTLQSMYVVYFDPMTMGQPHSHVQGCEEVWITIEGENTVLLGKELRKHTPETAFKVPPDGQTPHSSINVTDKPLKMICFARYEDHEVRE